MVACFVLTLGNGERESEEWESWTSLPRIPRVLEAKETSSAHPTLQKAAYCTWLGME